VDIQAKFDEFQRSFQGLSWSNVGRWPVVVKATIWIGAFAAVLAIAYFVIITPHIEQLSQEQKKEATLLSDFEEKAFKAANLDAYKKQLAEMEEAFGALLRQLPKDTEVPSLLEDISHTGLGSGLVFRAIDLGTESRKEFYAELPIEIVVTGDYHGFGAFVSGVAALPRIVTLHDFSIAGDSKAARSKGRDGRSGPKLLEMKITAKTYRYADEADKPAAPAKGKKGRAPAAKKK
jgi:type IV pilus assembly protein PilO